MISKLVKKNKTKQGFTLVELLTVVGAASFKTIQLKSRDARRKNDLASISKALNMYYSDVGTYPAGSPDINAMIKAVGVGFSANINGAVTVYMIEMPRETTTGVKDYSYMSTTGRSFKLFVNLENKEDGSCLRNSSGIIKSIDGYNVGDVGCIYGISSSNIKIQDSLL
jgi:type II secretory pathway pseudopilin PulG